jgi:hypothetical protein
MDINKKLYNTVNSLIMENMHLFPMNLEERDRFHIVPGKETVTKINLDTITTENDTSGEEYDHGYQLLHDEDLMEVRRIIEDAVADYEKIYKRSQD